ncbi:MAG: sigma-70 family RNA polymerase sigma factor [Deltaproteobacteria bacterium]|nr:sigma-70 family RNA polymerase sigma factor [Deltaproteobacteria bacterium]
MALAFDHAATGLTDVPPQVLSGERRVEALFRAHYPFVRRVLRYFGVPPSSVEDAAQDVFVVVTRNIDKCRDDVDERSWLLGIGRRIARNHRRTALRRRIRQLAVRAVVDVSGRPSLSKRHEQASLAAQLLEGLPERQRVVLVLSDLEDWTAPEIAAALEIKLNTVYSRLRLARRRLETLRAKAQGEQETP